MRHFANREGGPAWRDGKVPGFELKKTLAIGEGAVRFVAFTAGNILDRADGALKTQYGWEEADQSVVETSELPSYALRGVDIPPSILEDPDNVFRRTKSTNLDLYVPRNPGDVRAAIHFYQKVEYDCNGDIFKGLPVIDGAVVEDFDEEAGFETLRHDPAHGLQVVQYTIPGQPLAPSSELDSLEALLHGSGPEGLVNRCTEQMLAMMEFLRPPEYDEPAA